MRSRARLHLLCALGATFAVRLSHGAQARVYLRESVAAHPNHEHRLVAELLREGYSVERERPGKDTPCASSRDVGEPTAWLDFARDRGSATIGVTLCYAERGAAPRSAVLTVPAEDAGRLAVVTVEALNGFAARALSSEPTPQAPPRSPPEEDAPSRPLRTGWAAIASGVVGLDAGGGDPLLGVAGTLETAVSETLVIELETFFPLSPTTAEGLDRRLELRASWARAGARLAWAQHPFRVGLSVQAGAAAIAASAETRPPWIGTTDRTISALISGGLLLESPETSLLYLRAASRATRFIPSIDLALGDGRTRPFGELLLELHFGVGLRWERAD